MPASGDRCLTLPASGFTRRSWLAFAVPGSVLLGGPHLTQPALGATEPWSQGGVKIKGFLPGEMSTAPVTERELSGLCRMMFVDVCIFNHF